jgi:hypothetical protein
MIDFNIGRSVAVSQRSARCSLSIDAGIQSFETIRVATRTITGNLELLVGRRWRPADANSVSDRARSRIFCPIPVKGEKQQESNLRISVQSIRVSKPEQRARDGEELP